jgi:HK97 family phage major capsid protein
MLLQAYKDLSPVKKAALTLDYLTTNDGALPEEVAQRFIIVMIEQSEFMQMVKVVQMKSTTYRIPTQEYGSRALHKATRGQALPDAKRTRPTVAGPTITAYDYKAEVTMEKEVLESGVEGKRLQNLVMMEIMRRVKEDACEIAINSDDTSSDDDLDNYDGFYTEIATNTVAGGSARLSDTLITSLVKTLPKQFRKPAMVTILTASNPIIDYKNSVGDRVTQDGDKSRSTQVVSDFHGFKLVGDHEMPDDLGGSSNESVATIGDMKSYHLGFHRRIELDWDKNVREGTIFVVPSVRMGSKHAVEKGFAKMTAVLAS